MSGNMIDIAPAGSVDGLWRVSGETNGWLINRGSASMLIDCPRGDLTGVLETHRLPAPEIVIHTHIQTEHCWESESLPDARVFVAAGREDIATLSPRFEAACRTVWGPDRDWDERGVEDYGIAGCVTARPPAKPLALAGSLVPGETFRWQDIEFEVIALPGSDAHAIGFYWKSEGILFSGDLLLAGGWCVNLYDVERCYGIPWGYKELRASLETARRLATKMMCPSTGPVITNPDEDIARCLERTAWVSSPPARRTDRAEALTNYEPRRVIGNYREVLPGLYQQTNHGNVIVYIQPNGDGLMIDPGPCYWKPSWDETCAEMHSDLDSLEREAGLRRITTILATHFHGDHVECLDPVRERYEARFLATPDVAAVLERPEDFPYPCRVPWYGFPFDRVECDGSIDYGEAIPWGQTSITPIYTPGHCRDHAGFVIPWMGETTVCTGDVIQYGDGPIGFGLPIIYNDAGSPGLTTADACREIAKWRPTVLVGGHSHSCFDRDGSVLAGMLAVAEETDARLAAMVSPGQWASSATPPGYSERLEGDRPGRRPTLDRQNTRH